MKDCVALGYTLLPFLNSIKVSISFYVIHFFVSLDFLALYFKLQGFSANLCEVTQNTYLQLHNNRVRFGDGEISPGGI